MIFVFKKIDDIINGFNPIEIFHHYIEDKDYLVQYYYIEDQLGETPTLLANTGFNLNYFGIAGMLIAIVVTFLSVGNFSTSLVYVVIFLLIISIILSIIDARSLISKNIMHLLAHNGIFSIFY